MNNKELLINISEIHNNIASIMVSGDNAIIVGTTLLKIRELANKIQNDINEEKNNETQKAVIENNE